MLPEVKVTLSAARKDDDIEP
jgi:hypothetical protein